MKKRLISLGLVFALSLGLTLTGCNVKTDDEVSGGKNDKQDEVTASGMDPYKDNVKIAFIPNVIGDSVAAAWAEGMETELKNFDTVSFQTFDGEASVDTQVKIIDDLINQKYNAIILQSSDSAGLAASVKKAENAGIPVITANLDADTPHSSMVAMVDYEGGKQIAHAMAEKMNGKGKVVIIQATPGATKGENVSRGFKELPV